VTFSIPRDKGTFFISPCAFVPLLYTLLYIFFLRFVLFPKDLEALQTCQSGEVDYLENTVGHSLAELGAIHLPSPDTSSATNYVIDTFFSFIFFFFLSLLSFEQYICSGISKFPTRQNYYSSRVCSVYFETAQKRHNKHNLI